MKTSIRRAPPHFHPHQLPTQRPVVLDFTDPLLTPDPWSFPRPRNVTILAEAHRDLGKGF